jgi:hypothetical protein
VYDDKNGSSRRDTGEPGLAGQVVYLDLNFNGALDKGEPQRTTGTDGTYAFTGLDNGILRVRHVVPSGRRLTSPSAVFYDLPITPTSNFVNRNFGNTTTAVIRGNVFHDKDVNSRRGIGEEGLSGWTVFIDKDNDGQLDQNERFRITDATGDYRFTGLAPGAHRIRIVQQALFLRTNPLSGLWIVTVNVAQTVSNRNFGEFPEDNPRP